MKKFALAAAMLAASSAPAYAATAFDLEGVANGVYTSVIVNDGPLTMTITSTTPGAILVVDNAFAPPVVGRGIISNTNYPLTGFTFQPMKFAFNQAISSITFNFGDRGGDDDNLVRIEAYDAADTLLGFVTETFDAGWAVGKTKTVSFAGARYFIASSGSADRNFNSLWWDVSAITAGGTGGVPEPAAWAMMLAGFGLVGGAMRRRGALAAA